MIKIYYNHKLLQLDTHPPEFKDWEKWNIVNNYTGISEFLIFLDLMKVEPYLKNILFWNQNLEMMLNDLTSNIMQVEAAGGIVENKNGDLLFIKRLGKWDLPKGKIEKGESIQETALREIEEECGIDNLKLGSKICDTYHFYLEKDSLLLKKSYWFRVNYNGNDLNLKPQENENITEAKWLNKSDIAQIKNNTYPSILNILAAVNL
ncbi:MAG: NUDIX hydrolase [Bacteroidota bacterium]|jgi:8-oxo-dGTP pyrophosphatase MutT (NUDIX family)